MGWWGFGIYLDGFNNEPSDRTMYCIIPNLRFDEIMDACHE